MVPLCSQIIFPLLVWITRCVQLFKPRPFVSDTKNQKEGGLYGNGEATLIWLNIPIKLIFPLIVSQITLSQKCDPTTTGTHELLLTYRLSQDISYPFADLCQRLP